MLYRVRVRITETFDLAFAAADPGEACIRANAMTADELRHWPRDGDHHKTETYIRSVRPSPRTTSPSET